MHTPYVDELRSGKVLDLDGNMDENKLLYKAIKRDKIYLMKFGLEYDVQFGQQNPHRALYAYPLMHYNYWDEFFSVNPIDLGAFGENIILSGVDEFSTFIGDTYKFGEAVIQVSQPLLPKHSKFHPFSYHPFIDQMKETGKTGWFYRVIEEGYVEADTELQLLNRPYPDWSIAAINEAIYKDKFNLRSAYELSQCELLSPELKRIFTRRLQGLA